MTLEPIESFDTKSRLAYEAIKQSVIEGMYMPGEKIGISQVAKKLNTSDVPVREAMHRLVSEGILEHIPHVGFKVTRPEFQKYTEVYEVRQLLEGEAARKAALNITESSLEEMRQLHKEMLAVDLNGELSSFSPLNHRFHAVLYAASNNSVLVRQIEQLGSIYPRTRAIFAIIPERIVSANHEHEEIIRCLEQRDSEGTQKALLDHMAHGYNLLLSYKEALQEKAG